MPPCAWSYTGHCLGVPVLAVGWAHWARSTLQRGCVVLPQECGWGWSGKGEAVKTIPQNSVCTLVWQTSLRMGIRYILAKQTPLTPDMGQTGLDGSILVFPGVRVGLG